MDIDTGIINATNLPPWTFVLLVIAFLATCAVTNATEDMALAACYSAGFSPEECDR